MIGRLPLMAGFMRRRTQAQQSCGRRDRRVFVSHTIFILLRCNNQTIMSFSFPLLHSVHLKHELLFGTHNMVFFSQQHDILIQVEILGDKLVQFLDALASPQSTSVIKSVSHSFAPAHLHVLF